MIRILQITAQLERNGTETFIMNVFRNIDRSKFQFDFLINSPSHNGYYNEACNLGARIYYIPSRKKGYIKYLKELNSFFKKHSHEYDAVHFNGNSFTSIEALYFAKIYGIKQIIAHSHNSKTSGIHNVILHKINRIFIPKIATSFLACSDLALKWAYSRSIIKTARIIHNGIDLNKYKFDQNLRKQKRDELNIGKELVIGTIGRLTEVKNHTFLIDIFSEILKIQSEAILIIVGNGKLKQALVDKTKDLNIEDRVILTGERDDVPELLNAFDAFVLPSLYEGLPFVGIEAQANGLPTFISENVSKQIILTDKVFLLSLDEKPKYWANYILNHIDYIRDNLSKNIKNFSIVNTVRELEKIYSK